MDLRAKHSSNREKLQRKIVKYSKRTKNRREEKKLLPLLMNLRAKHSSNTQIQQTKVG